MINLVQISNKALKDLKKTPVHIKKKFNLWLSYINDIGLEKTKKIPGWHDEPLQGNRKGQRSVRLNIQWRAIYVIKEDIKIEFIEIIEVTPHDY